MQAENIENFIERIKKQQLSKKRLIHLIGKIVKIFTDYTKQSEKLPPQTLIPCCLFILPKKFQELLDIKDDQLLQDQPQNKSVQIVLVTYLNSMVKLLTQSAQQIKHVIVESMAKSIFLTGPFPKITKKWIKTLLDIWSSNHENINLCLRCFMAINKFLQTSDEQLYMWTVRRAYVGYFANSKQISWRNLQHVNFMINCFCQWVKHNQNRAYYILFGYLRSIALQLSKINKSKKKQKVELINKLFSNQILNCFKLFVAIVSRVQSDELTSLIYPLIQLMSAYEKISEAAQFLPLKLHVLTFYLNIMESTGVYIPQTLELIQKLITNSLFTRKLTKRSQKMQGDLELSYKLSPSDLINTNLINQIFKSIYLKSCWFISIISKTAGGSEIIKKMNIFFKKLEFSFSGYKQIIKQIAKCTKEDSIKSYKVRMSKHLSIFDKKDITLLEKKLIKTKFLSSEKYQQLKQENQELLKQKLVAQNEDGEQQDEQNEQNIQEDDDELNSGWEEAESGASQFEDEEQQMDSDEQLEEEKQDVSYEGDPEDQDAQEMMKQWSQQEWASQDQMQQQQKDQN